MTTLDTAFIKGETKPGQYSDNTNGLVLRIGKNGKKTWVVRRRQSGGGSTTVRIGYFPAVTLYEARKRALDICKQLDDGINPNEEKRQQRAGKLAAKEVQETERQKE